MIRKFFKLLSFLIIFLIIFVVTRLFVFGSFEVPSGSMENTLKVGNKILVTKFSIFHKKNFKRGDIIVFEDPGGWMTNNPAPTGWHKFMLELGFSTRKSDDSEYLVKRVIGLPGDHIKCTAKCKFLTINGVKIDEREYIKDKDASASEEPIDVTVPDGMLYVLGDNRYDSADSRFNTETKYHGFVPTSYVVGQVKLVFYPFNQFHFVKNPSDVFKNVPDNN